MNTIDSLRPAPWVPVRRKPGPGWLVRLFGWAMRRPEAHGAGVPEKLDPRLDGLLDLDAHTLADIGAPEPFMARAMARRESRRQERDHLRMGIASGGWYP